MFNTKSSIGVGKLNAQEGQESEEEKESSNDRIQYVLDESKADGIRSFIKICCVHDKSNLPESIKSHFDKKKEFNIEVLAFETTEEFLEEMTAQKNCHDLMLVLCLPEYQKLFPENSNAKVTDDNIINFVVFNSSAKHKKSSLENPNPKVWHEQINSAEKLIKALEKMMNKRENEINADQELYLQKKE